MTLPEYLREVASKPFARGECDCCIFVADWVLAQTGRDPAEGLRGYSTDRGAMLRIGRAGGFLELAATSMAKVGMKAVQTPVAGDVAIVKAGDRLTFAIRTSTAWACKEGDGITLGLFEPVAIWRA